MAKLVYQEQKQPPEVVFHNKPANVSVQCCKVYKPFTPSSRNLCCNIGKGLVV